MTTTDADPTTASTAPNPERRRGSASSASAPASASEPASASAATAEAAAKRLAERTRAVDGRPTRPAASGACSSSRSALWFFADVTLGIDMPAIAWSDALAGRPDRHRASLVLRRGDAARPAPRDGPPLGQGDGSATDRLELADWRRRVADLYATVRAEAADGPASAPGGTGAPSARSCTATHPQSPVPAAERAAFTARHLAVRPAPAVRGRARRREPAPRPPARRGGVRPRAAVNSGGDRPPFSRIGRWRCRSPTGRGARRVLDGRLRGRPVPARSATRRTAPRPTAPAATSLDAAKSADLGRRREPGQPRPRLQLRVPAVVRVRPALGVPAGAAGEPPRHADRGRRAPRLRRRRPSRVRRTFPRVPSDHDPIRPRPRRSSAAPPLPDDRHDRRRRRAPPGRDLVPPRGDEIVINSPVGRRWPANLLRDPRIAVAVIDGADAIAGSGCRASSTTVTDQPTAQADIAEMARRYHADDRTRPSGSSADRFAQPGADQLPPARSTPSTNTSTTDGMAPTDASSGSSSGRSRRPGRASATRRSPRRKPAGTRSGPGTTCSRSSGRGSSRSSRAGACSPASARSPSGSASA